MEEESETDEGGEEVVYDSRAGEDPAAEGSASRGALIQRDEAPDSARECIGVEKMFEGEMGVVDDSGEEMTSGGGGDWKAENRFGRECLWAKLRRLLGRSRTDADSSFDGGCGRNRFCAVIRLGVSATEDSLFNEGEGVISLA